MTPASSSAAPQRVLTWVVSTAPGYWLGAAADPHRFGLDMVMPAFFAAMLVSLWQGPRSAIRWAVGGAVAVAADLTLGGFWYVVLGGLLAASREGSPMISHDPSVYAIVSRP